jgi:hypothetical protein
MMGEAISTLNGRGFMLEALDIGCVYDGARKTAGSGLTLVNAAPRRPRFD